MKNKRICNIMGLFSLVIIFVVFSFVPGLLNSNALTNRDNINQPRPLNSDASKLNKVERFPIIETPNMELKLTEKVERYNEHANQIKETYSIKIRNRIIGYLIYDSYVFNNGDLYYYLKYEPEGINPTT